MPGSNRAPGFREKVFRAETKVLDAAAGRVQAIMSTEAEDREGDVIRAAGWDLTSFLKHPVLLSSHDYRSLRSQIGEWEDVKVRGKQLIGVARYYIGEGNPEADWGYKLAEKGRAAYSVGFIPLEWQERDTERDSCWGSYEFTKQELLETSHVTVPANAEALQLMVGAKGLHPVLAELAREQLGDHLAGLDGEHATHKAEGVCIGCELPALVTAGLCRGCLQSLLTPESAPGPMLSLSRADATDGSLWVVREGSLVPAERTAATDPPANDPAGKTPGQTDPDDTVPATTAAVDWNAIVRDALSRVAAEGVS